MVTTSTALLSVNLSWMACTGTLGDLRVTYTHDNATTLRVPVTLPLRNSYVPLSGLESGATYSLSLALLTEDGLNTGPLLSGLSFETDGEIPPIECKASRKHYAIVSSLLFCGVQA